MGSSRDCFGKHRVLEQYYVAAMLFIVNAIYPWMFLNILHSFFSAGFLGVEDHFFFPALKLWTQENYTTFFYAISGGQICTLVPAALLIYLTSSHKFLTEAVAMSSIIHMLTPVAVNLFPSSLAYMLCAYLLVQAPHQIGVLSMWKDWAPPGKRMKFVCLSFSSLILSCPFLLYIVFISKLHAAKEEIFYISGACGLGWSLLWNFTVTDTPANKPRLPSYVESCLQNITCPTVKKRPKLSEVPWKNILTSNPVFALCLAYFKIGSSFVVLMTTIPMFAFQVNKIGYLGYTHFLIIFAVLYAVILFTSTIASDICIIKYPSFMKDIRKRILYKALIIHGILLIGTKFSHPIGVICFCLSYFIFSTCLAGFFTNALDLSSRYVTIIGGFIETFYLLGILMSVYYLKFIFQYTSKNMDSNPFGKIVLYEVVVTIIVAIVFIVWGSVEEQPWSADTVADTMPEGCELRAVPNYI